MWRLKIDFSGPDVRAGLSDSPQRSAERGKISSGKAVCSGQCDCALGYCSRGDSRRWKSEFPCCEECKNTGAVDELSVDGVFVAVGITPNSQPFSQLLTLDHGYVAADETCETGVPGVFAAGDVRKKQLRQIVTAVATAQMQLPVQNDI